MLPRDAKPAACSEPGMLENLRPPEHQSGGLQPEGVLRPLRIQHVHRVARATQRLTFLSATLRELVDADDVPALAQGGYPFQVWGTAAESVG